VEVHALRGVSLTIQRGELVIFSLSRIPWVGSVLFAIFSSLGLGAVIASRFGSGGPWSLNILT
jgi:hypothetical protein